MRPPRDTVHRRLNPGVHHLACWLALAVGATGCTAIKATVHVAQAEQALAEARNRDAQNLAVYEYTMAIRYLEKAREEHGSADYRISENLSKRSAEWSDKAIISIERGRKGIDMLEDDVGALPTAPVKPLEDALPEGGAEPLEDLDETPRTPKPTTPADDLDEWDLDE